ncbi:2-C-methyl-D-erythritol 4-phosphate cytidylyltransferase [Nocardioides sp. zg-536]|uniref:2-C-methyl-D-erythritol 4-phosphate cytidylyltransferase n=1 Tax=Nocardioides faecalis TaxID=2803858 RepID=A0A938Y6C0_9ACTN|nr:2-C-methyl-D-erythritol 4-phosphate cytidylyltransferase [Nocardioides faecalis]MBM9458316.1 2-C-methyl-D-erythritol 4-phosphate cytidylyltransferase [Nocardioides faecalis]QVI58342.1 2-C-methyl-D-erythritol 4-phosphate cytidylyltransferase [Nocardioides faecalis]
MSPHPYDVVGFSVPASGIVLEEGRGSLPFHLIHGESLVAAAAWAAGEAGIDLLDQTLGWDDVAERGGALVLHDPLCPMTPPDFLARCAERAEAADEVVVGVRPVTDTVKVASDAGGAAEGGDAAEGGAVLGETVDREGLVSVCSPVVLPSSVVTDLLADGGRLPSLDFVELTAALRERYGADRVALVEAPPQARRVASEEDLAVLAALTDPR